jgi:zinc and cadmium transporter
MVVQARRMVQMLTNTFAAVMLASFLACAFTTIGIYAIAKFEKWGREYSAYFMSFAAGVLISVSFMHIIPESFQMNSRAPVFLLGGFLAIHLSNRLLQLYACDEVECTDYAVGVIPMLGIGFHSFIDGLIYSVTFNVSVLTGALAAIGMILHEFPEGIVTFVLLERGGFSRRKSVIYAFLAAAVSTPLGALVSYPFIENISRPLLGILLAISAGALVYVGASHLLPAVEKENKKYSILALGAGVLVAVIIIWSKG